MKRNIAVFIASPGDLSEERRLFRDAIHQLNVGFGDGADIEYEPLGWEDTLASTGRRNQSVINGEIDRCEVFILAMYRRWGQEAPDAKPYSSYTEEEFHRALERWKKNGVPEIFIFFKRVDAASEADPGPQLIKVLDFKKQLEETRSILYRYFNSGQDFINEIDRHLRAYAKNELPKADQQQDIVVLPIAAIKEVEDAKVLAAQKAAEAKKAYGVAENARLKLEEMQLQTAQDAAQLSREGKIEFARQKFSELAAETVDIRILYLAYEFFERTGDLDSASSVLIKWLNLSGPDKKSKVTANAYCNLGNLYRIRGDFNSAEKTYQKSLSINEGLGDKEGMAVDFNNLGTLYQIQGELDNAEKMYQKALTIEEALGRKEGMASDYGNLGILYQTRGDLNGAEKMYQKALATHEALGCKEGMASGYGNLGNLYQAKGDLESAEKMYQKSLTIEEALGSKEGMARNYSNLGTLYQTRGDLDNAKEMYQKSLAINEALGRKEGIASDYGNLGILYRTRGDLNRAEKMYQKALSIHEALRQREGMARDYGNLGNLYQTRGDLDSAEKLHKKALTINEAFGYKEGVARDHLNLGSLYQTRGDLYNAEKMYQESLLLYREIKSPHVEMIIKLLNDLQKDGSNGADTET